jgi:hypothetical protein
LDQLDSELGHAIRMGLSKTLKHLEVLTFDMAKLSHTRQKLSQIFHGLGRVFAAKEQRANAKLLTGGLRK